MADAPSGIPQTAAAVPRSLPSLKNLFPEGSFPQQYKKYLAIVIALFLLAVFWFSGGSSSATQPQAMNPVPQVKTLPPAPSRIADLDKRMREESAAIAKQSNADEATLKALGQQPTLGQLTASTPEVQQPAAYSNVPADPYRYGSAPAAPKEKAAVSVSSIVQDLRRGAVQPAAPVVDANVPAPPQAVPEAVPSSVDKLSDVVSSEAKNKDLLVADPAWPTAILPEGFVIETVLMNKLEGSDNGPVKCMVTTAIYAPGTRTLLFPQGTEMLGSVTAVSAFGQSRLAVKFQRALVQSGPHLYGVRLGEEMPALDQEGGIGLHDKVNNHWLSTFAVAGVIGAIAGLSEIGNTSSGFGINPEAQFRSGVTQQMSESSMQILNRFLNRMPSVTIRPGTRVKLMLMSDLKVPLYKEDL